MSVDDDSLIECCLIFVVPDFFDSLSQERTFDDHWFHQPLRDIVCHGALFRQASFAEAVQKMLCIRFVAERQGMARCLRREPGRKL